jgi:hypothetical protein
MSVRSSKPPGKLPVWKPARSRLSRQPAQRGSNGGKIFPRGTNVKIIYVHLYFGRRRPPQEQAQDEKASRHLSVQTNDATLFLPASPVPGRDLQDSHDG